MDTTDTSSTDLAALAALTAVVTEQDAAHCAAIEAEQQATAAELQRVLDTVRPALRAVCSRVQVGYAAHHQGDVNYDQGASRQYLAERGLYLDTDDPGPGQENPRANGGRYLGTDLFLLGDGRLAWLTYSGSWSRWQGSSSSWDADVEYVPAEMAAVEMAAQNRGPRAIAAIRAALAAQADGTKPKATTAALARAERLTALATLAR